MLGSVFVRLALHPGFALGFADQFLRLTKLDSLFLGEALRAFRSEHHVRRIFEDLSGNLNGILDAMQSGGSAGAKRCAVHDDGVAFDVAVQIEVRAVTGVEDGVVLEDNDGGFDGVQSGAAAAQDGPTRSESVMAAGCASVYGFVRNVPSAAMNNESRFHRNQNGKGTRVCPGEAERWPEEKELNTEITEFAPTESGQAPFTEKKKPSNKEIENKKKETDEEKNGAGIDAPARKTAQRADKGSGDGFETGFFADAVERAGWGIAGEVSAENGNLIVDPHRKFATVAPP